MDLASNEREVKRQALRVAQDMNLATETTPRASQGMIYGLEGVLLFAPSAATSRSSDRRAINTPEVIATRPIGNRVASESSKNSVKSSILVPFVKEIPGRGPWTKLCWQVTPWCSCPEYPKDRIYDHPWISGPPSGSAVLNPKQIGDQIPLSVGE